VEERARDEARSPLSRLEHIQPALPSRRGEAVVAGGVIGPLRVAEMGQSVGEREALERNPIGAGQVGAGFDDDGDIGCAGDV